MRNLSKLLVIGVVACAGGCAGEEGPEGPQGPPGPQGEMGEMGEMGTPGMGGSSVMVTRAFKQFTVPNQTETIMDVDCPAGFSVTGGGWVINDGVTVGYNVRASHWLDPDTWSVRIWNENAGEFAVTAFAVCANAMFVLLP